MQKFKLIIALLALLSVSLSMSAKLNEDHLTIPYFNNFDTLADGTRPDGWSILGSTSSAVFSNPARIWGSYNYNGNHILRISGWGIPLGTATLTSPLIDIPAGKPCLLSFKYAHFSTAYPLKVRVSTNNGATYTDLLSLPCQVEIEWSDYEPTVLTDASVDLSQFAGQTIRLQFYVECNDGGYAMNLGSVYLDELSITTCTLLQASVSDIAATSVDIAVPETCDWQVSYGYVGTLPDNGTIVDITNSSTCTLSSLEPMKSYVFYTRRNCGVDGVSGWSPAVPFNTGCSTISLPYSEDFEHHAADEHPVCWNSASTVAKMESGSPWDIREYNFNKWLRVRNVALTTTGTAILNSPSIFLPAGQPCELSFGCANQARGVALNVGVSTDGGTSFTTLQSVPSGSATSPDNVGTPVPVYVNLSDYASQSVIIQFSANLDNAGGAIFIDNLFTSTCIGVDAEIHRLTSNSVTFSLPEACDWEISYGIPGISPAEGTMISATNDSLITVSGLEPNTKYVVYSRLNCGNGNYGRWSSEISFKTDCGVVETPFFESFADYTNYKPVDCWDNSASTCKNAHNSYAGYIWGAYQDMLRLDRTRSAAGTMLVNSPSIALPNISRGKLLLSFDYANKAGVDLLLKVSKNNEDTFSIFQSLPPTSTTTSGSVTSRDLVPVSFDITQFAGDTVTFQFFVEATARLNGSMAFSNFSVTVPSCSKIIGEITYQSNDSVTVTVSDTCDWQIAYGYRNTPVENCTIINVSDASEFTLTGLDVAKHYTVWVRRYCDSTDVSEWSEPMTFFTYCEPVLSVPYFEDFNSYENNTTLNCWDNITPSSPEVAANPDLLKYVWGIINGSMYFRDYYLPAGVAAINTPLFYLPAGHNYELNFALSFSGGADHMDLRISTDNGATFSDLATYYPPQVQFYGPYFTDEVLTVDLSAYAGDTIMLQFSTNSTDITSGYNIYVDNFSILTCSRLEGALTALTDSTATISVPESCNWQISYGDAGFDPNYGAIASISNGSSFTFPVPEHGHHYEAYVRRDCGSEGFSQWSRAIKVYTPVEKIISVPYFDDFNKYNQWDFVEGWDPSLSTAYANQGAMTYFWGIWVANNNPCMHLYNIQLGVGSALSNSPRIHLPAGENYALSFDYAHLADCGDFAVRVSADNGVSFTELQRFSNTTGVIDHNVYESTLEANIDLSQFAGNDIIIQLFAVSGGSGSIYIDNLAVTKCLRVHADAEIVSPTSVKFTAEENCDWQISYGFVGTEPENGTVIDVINADEFIFTDLHPMSDYVFYTRRKCGNDNYSLWSRPTNLRLPCTTLTAPYYEDFDRFKTDTTALCWDISGNTDNYVYTQYVWAVLSAGQDNKAMIFHSNNENTYRIIKSPQISIPTDGNYSLTFNYSNQTENTADLDLNISTDGGSTFSTLSSYPASAEPLPTDPDYGKWKAAPAIDMSPYAGQTIILQFSALPNRGFRNILIDNLAISECARLNGSADLVKKTTVVVRSNENCDWQYSYALSGTQAKNGTIVSVPAGTMTDTVTGLLALSSYDFFVRRSCGNGEFGPWSLAMTVMTDCGGSSLPYYMDFEDIELNAVPECWSFASSDEATGVYTDRKEFFLSENSTRSLQFDAVAGNTSDWLIAVLPEFYDIQIAQLFCNYRIGELSKDNLYFGYLTDADDYSSFVALEALPQTVEMSPFKRTLANLPAEAERLAFKYVGNLIASIDNIRVGNPQYYVTWNNYDGTELGVDTVAEGVVPVYTGVTPERPDSAWRKFEFSGWEPEPDSAFNDMTYTAVFEHTNFIVEVEAENGSVDGDGVYDRNEVATLTAYPAKDYKFSQWSNGETANPLTIAVTSDTTITAIFIVDNFIISATADETMGSTTGAGEYAYGATATLTATPNAHYHFVNWSNGSTQNPLTITVDKDSTLTATFAIDVHNIATTVNDETMGSTTGAREYAYGATATLTATPNAHYHFVNWSNGSTQNPLTLTVDKDSTLTATFAIDVHNIATTVNDETMGSAIGAGEYAYGATATLTATPNAHYHFVNWSNGSTQNPLTFTVDKDSTLTANFAIDQHTVTVISNDVNLGSVTSSGVYDYGTPVAITATPVDYYVSFTGWSNGVMTPSVTINLTSDTTIVGFFELNDYTISLNTNNDDMGSVSGAGVYTYGDVATITATPAFCHHFVDWSDGDTHITRAITVANDLTLTANFAIDEYTISVSANNTAAGKAYCNNGGAEAASMSVDCGTVVEIHAEAETYYHFVEWSDGSEDAIRNIDVTSDTDLVAIFEPNCGDGAELPVVFLYNGLLMIDLDSLKARNYDPKPTDVTWYQVVDDVDMLEDDIFPLDDKALCTGYYLSLPTNNVDYGQYYAVVNVGNSKGLCQGEMKTVVTEYVNANSKPRVEMAPTSVKTGDYMTITGLVADEKTVITVCDYTGKTIETMQTEGVASYDFKACGVAGVYIVKVASESVNETLRFVVTK